MRHLSSTICMSLAFGLLLVFLPTALGAGRGLQQAVEESEKTGKPILAIAGEASDPLVREFEQRLVREPATKLIVSQSIVLRLDTKVGEDWLEWTKLHHAEGGGRPPILYLVRADGEMLFGKGGLTPDGDWIRELALSAPSVGRPLTAAEANRIRKAVDEATELYAQGEVGKAVDKLARCVGTGSYAKPAVEADALAQKMRHDAEDRIADAEERLGIPESSFRGAVELQLLADLYGKLPELGTDLKRKVNDLQREPGNREVFREARVVVPAIALHVKGDKAKAKASYERIVSQGRDAQAVALAEARLAALDEPPPEFARRESKKTAGDAEPGDGANGVAQAPPKAGAEGEAMPNEKDGKAKGGEGFGDRAAVAANADDENLGFGEDRGAKEPRKENMPGNEGFGADRDNAAPGQAKKEGEEEAGFGADRDLAAQEPGTPRGSAKSKGRVGSDDVRALNMLRQAERFAERTPTRATEMIKKVLDLNISEGVEKQAKALLEKVQNK